MSYFIKGWGLLFLLMIFCADSFAQQKQVEQLHLDINTKSYDEIAPIVSRDEQTMFFTRQGYPIYNKQLIEKGVDLSKTLSPENYRRKLSEIFSSISGKSITDATKSSYNQDIWVSRTKNTLLDQVSHPGTPLNNAFPNSLCALYNNEQSAIVINQFPEEGGIQPGFSVCHKNKSGNWSDPQPIFIQGVDNNIAPEVSLAVAEEGEAIILSLDHRDAYGGNDLFVAFRTGDNSFGKPIHLGPAVNSQSHEKAPFLSSDGKTMFFSSNRQNVLGGYDLFMVYRLDDSWTNWTAPKRFLSPINTSANEGFPCFNRTSGYLYFSSDRNGSSDIFRVSIAPPISEEVRVVGNILDSSKKRKQDAKVLLRSKESGIYQSTFVSTNGYYEIDVPMGKTFQILAQKPGYQSDRKMLNFKKSDIYFKAFHINLALKPLEEGATIDLNTIYFKKSTAIILPESFEELDYLSEILTQNKSLVISIEGHTDNQGGKNSLKRLSQERAKVIKKHLIKNGGITKDRIIAEGFGDSQPLNDNSSETLRQQNRRVEIKVVRIEADVETENSTVLKKY